MAKIIKQGQVHTDDWHILRLSAEDNLEDLNSLALPGGPLLIPQPLWLAHRAEFSARLAAGEALGIWLAPTDEPADIAADVQRFAVIGVDFPKFVDGRGYSIARLLRSRYGYQGELRAIGDVQRDQLFYMRRVGFDAFALRADHDIHAALRSLQDFTGAYQHAWDQGLQLRRKFITAASAVATSPAAS